MEFYLQKINELPAFPSVVANWSLSHAEGNKANPKGSSWMDSDPVLKRLKLNREDIDKLQPQIDSRFTGANTLFRAMLSR